MLIDMTHEKIPSIGATSISLLVLWALVLEGEDTNLGARSICVLMVLSEGAINNYGVSRSTSDVLHHVRSRQAQKYRDSFVRVTSPYILLAITQACSK